MEDLNDKVTNDILKAAEFVQPMSEIQNVIENLGQTLTSSDLNQLGKGLAGYVANGNFYTDSGSVNSYVLSQIGLKQSSVSYEDGMNVEFIAANTNTGTSTVNVAALGVKNIVGTSGGGEISLGARIILRYRSGSGDFEIIASEIQEIRPVTAAVASNDLTVGLDPSTLDFRSPSLTVGSVNSRTTPAISLVVPNGATMGTVDTVQSKLILLAIDNAGTIELAIVNLAGGVNLDETTLISTIAISAASDSDNVVYSTTARSSVPFRVVGFVDSTQAVAGVWSTSPSVLQGAGGNALTALSSIGYGQVWKIVARTAGTTYYNTTGKPISLSIQYTSTGSGTIDISVAGVLVVRSGGPAGSYSVGAIIPAMSSYVIAASGTQSIDTAVELR